MAFFIRKKSKRNSKKSLDFNSSSLGNDGLHRKNIEEFNIFAVSVNSLMDIKKAIELLKNGNPVLISVKKLRKQNSEKAEDFLRRLIEFASSAKLNLMGISDSYLIMTPHWINIKKMEPTSTEETLQSDIK